MIIKYNESTAANRRMIFECRNTTTLQLQTGITFADGEIHLVVNGVASNADETAVVEIGAGQYYLQLTQVETQVVGVLSLYSTKSNTQIPLIEYQIDSTLTAGEGGYRLSTTSIGDIWDSKQESGHSQTIYCAGIKTPRSLTIASSGGGNNSYVVYSKTTGVAMSYEVLNNGANQTLTASYAANKVTVSLATNSLGVAQSRASEVIDKINRTYTVQARVGAKRATNTLIDGVAATVSSTALSSESATTGDDSNSGLTKDAKKATFAGAIAAAASVPGTLIILDDGIFFVNSSNQLPPHTTIRGSGKHTTFIRTTQNTSNATYLHLAEGCVLEDLTIDAQLAFASGIFLSTAAGDKADYEIRRCVIKSGSYAIWLSSDASGGVQQNRLIVEDSELYSAVSSLSTDGGSTGINHEIIAKNCTIVADSWYYGDLIAGGSYAILAVTSSIWLTNCHVYAYTSTAQAISGGIQAGDPTELDKPGKVWASGGSIYALNGARTKPKRIESIADVSNQAVFTVTNHGYITDDYVEPEGLVGSSVIAGWNGRAWKCDKINNNSFKLKHALTSVYLEIGSGTYTTGTGTVRNGIEWGVFSLYSGSEVYLGSDIALNHWSVKAVEGVIHSPGLTQLEKLSLLQSGRKYIVYVNPSTGVDFPVAFGWDPAEPWRDIQDAIKACHWGDTLYMDIGDSGDPIEIDEPLVVPPGVNLEGRGVDRTRIVCNFAGGDEDDIAIICSNNNKLEGFTLVEGDDCNGVTGIATNGTTTLVLDHLKILTTFDTVRSLSGTLNVENCRLISSSGNGVTLNGNVTCFIGGIHPYTQGVSAVKVSNNADATIEGLAIATGSYVFDADGSGSSIYAAGCNFDITKIRTTNSATIRTEENVASIVMDTEVEDGWSFKKGLRILLSTNAGALTISGSNYIFKSLTGLTNRITGTNTDSGRSSITLDGDDE